MRCVAYLVERETGDPPSIISGTGREGGGERELTLRGGQQTLGQITAHVPNWTLPRNVLCCVMRITTQREDELSGVRLINYRSLESGVRENIWSQEMRLTSSQHPEC